MSAFKDKTNGNQGTTADLGTLLQTVKSNIMQNTNVAEVGIVKEIKNDKYIISLINNNELQIYCEKLENLIININDIVLCVFTNSDFRQNLKKVKNNIETNNFIQYGASLHTLNNGIIIGIIHSNKNK